MLEIIQYVTSGFWVFVGCLILILVVGELVAIVGAIYRRGGSKGN